MTNLTTAQSDLLAQIVAAPEGVMDAPEDARSNIKSLIKRGMLISMPVAGGPSRLLITEAGRKEIGAAPAEAAIRPDRKAKGSGKAPKEPLAPRPQGKIATLVDLLRRPDGATIEAMMAATGWQAHSVRGAMSGSVKKTMGLTITSEKTDAGRIYRVDGGATA